MTTITIRTISVFVLAALLLATGCQESTGPNQENPPELPPEGTFVMNFADFDTTSANPAVLQKTQVGTNWLYSAINVGVWNTILTIGMAVPVASFVAAFDRSDPVQQDDGSWIWSYNFNALGARHTAKLQAQTENDGIRWDMFISRENGYTDYHWYTGWSNLVATEGFWVLSKRVPDVEFLRIDWSRNSSDTVAEITYTDIETGAAGNGNYIRYGINEETPYNAFYQIYNNQQTRLIDIEWHRQNHNGRVMDEAHFGNPNWQCWDEQLNNITCP